MSRTYSLYLLAQPGILSADILGLNTDGPAVTAAVITSAFGLLIAAFKAIAWAISGPRDRRRALYGTAYQQAMAWVEMLYRVRRRGNDEASARELVERFHALQEQIDYHRGWLGSESKYLARSYCRLVGAIKCQTEPLMRTAWSHPGCEPGEPVAGNVLHPSVEQYSLDFLTDVRLHLSLWPVIPLLRLAWRNRDDNDNASPPKGEKEATNA